MATNRSDLLGPAIFLLIFLWFGTLIFALALASGSDRENMEKFGLLGDAFGFVNALFTGLGILGLIYTVRLQQKQIEEQAKEGDRQAREMFLTARFNARSAKIEARRLKQESRRSNTFQGIGSSLDGRSVDAEIIAIELLEFEAKQGFGGGAWTSAIQKEAIRQYAVDVLERFAVFYFMPRTDSDYDPSQAYLVKAMNKLEALAAHIGKEFPDLWQECGTLRAFLDKSMENPRGAAEWCKFADSYLVKGAATWV